MATSGVELRDKEPYDQPLLVRHGPLRDVTGTVKYQEKDEAKDTSDTEA